MAGAAVHEALEAISFLLGTWVGTGRGIYPTIADFEYREESRFWHDGRPFLFYEQKTWRGDSPSHSEVGFWRPQPAGSVEIVLAHTNGIVEIQTGFVHGQRIETHSMTLEGSPSAKKVERLARVYSVDGDALTYTMNMAFLEHPLQQHLEARLERSEP